MQMLLTYMHISVPQLPAFLLALILSRVQTESTVTVACVQIPAHLIGHSYRFHAYDTRYTDSRL
jgi:hypothetical protein